MADCFWTDMVGCGEDCGGAVVAQSAYMSCVSSSGTGGVTVFPAPDADPFVGGVLVVSARSWRANQTDDPMACDWTTYCINANGQTVDDVVPDDEYPVAHTFKPESFFAASGALFAGAVGLAMTDSGFGDGHFTIDYQDLLGALGFDTTANIYGGGTFVLELVDGAGTPYIATGIYSTCF